MMPVRNVVPAVTELSSDFGVGIVNRNLTGIRVEPGQAKNTRPPMAFAPLTQISETF
jgi:hypothetical protein